MSCVLCIVCPLCYVSSIVCPLCCVSSALCPLCHVSSAVCPLFTYHCWIPCRRLELLHIACTLTQSGDRAPVGIPRDSELRGMPNKSKLQRKGQAHPVSVPGWTNLRNFKFQVRSLGTRRSSCAAAPLWTQIVLVSLLTIWTIPLERRGVAEDCATSSSPIKQFF